MSFRKVLPVTYSLQTPKKSQSEPTRSLKHSKKIQSSRESVDRETQESYADWKYYIKHFGRHDCWYFRENKTIWLFYKLIGLVYLYQLFYLSIRIALRSTMHRLNFSKENYAKKSKIFIKISDKIMSLILFHERKQGCLMTFLMKISLPSTATKFLVFLRCIQEPFWIDPIPSRY